MAMSRFVISAYKRGVCVALAAVVLIVAASYLTDVGAARASTADEAQNVFQTPDRRTMRKLSQSHTLIQMGRYGEAVRYLGEILEEPEDFFIRADEKSPVYTSLKSEAERIIGRLPAKGRELYELQFGAQARQMLTDALKSGDVLRLAEVSRRFFHTGSGYEATLLLGLHHFDHNRPLAGALVLQRLGKECTKKDDLEPTLSLTIAACWLQAGMPDKARESLTALRKRDPTLRVSVAGREVPLFADDANAIQWLSDLIGQWPECEELIPKNWLMFRGNSSRNAPTDGGAPLLNKRWRVPATDDPLTESVLASRGDTAGRNGPAISMLHPLAVGDVLLMRTVRNLLAVDFATGKRLWDVPVAGPFEAAQSSSVIIGGNAQNQQWMALQGAAQRVCGDLTYGTLSSDGRLVFSVEDLGMEYGNEGQLARRVVLMGIVGRRASRTNIDTLTNRLTAHDIRTGKLTWEIGGPTGQHSLHQADTFFLGPPLPLMGKLYVLAETKGEVRLLALDSSTGDLLWSQQLSLVEQSVLTAAQRRWEGVSPSYADGVLVCPTSTGAVVGVELATRALLWGYCYNTDSRRNGMRNSRHRMNVPSRWLDNGATIHNGKVLITPQNSNWLHCLNLIDGEFLWKQQRKNDLYLACVHESNVVLVSAESIRALNLSDGNPAWDKKTIDLPGDGVPSGRGFASGDRYFLPLSTAEVAAVDLSAVKIAGVSKSQDGVIPGNLICHKGMVISQGVHGVDVYFQLDVALAEAEKRLKANPNDAWALSLCGEIQLDAGKRSEAIGYFRRAYELSHAPRSREMLRDSLLEGLRTEFAAYRNQEGEIETLLDNPTQQAAYLRLMASGLKGEKEWDGAFSRYLTLIDLAPGRPPLDQVEPGLIVRRDRWIREQLADLRKEATGEPAVKIDEYVSTRLESALVGDSVDPLRRFLDYFGGVPAAKPADTEFLRRLKDTGKNLEIELSLPPAKTARNTINVDWPKGNVESSTAKTKNLAALNKRYYPLKMHGDPGPYFRDLTIKYDHSHKAVAAFDGLGQEKWKLSLAEELQQNNFPYNYTMTHARAVGHLLVVALGWNVFAIDTLDLNEEGQPQVLWVKNMATPNFTVLDRGGFGKNPFPVALMPVQMQRQLSNSQDQMKLIGLANSRYVCLRRFNNVVAVDPVSGETLWIRQDMPKTCDVFGDEQHLFVLSTDREEAALLRGEDGKELGGRKLPRRTSRRGMPNGKVITTFSPLSGTCIATIGRKLLLWWQEGNQRELTLIDPLEQRDEWLRRKFSHQARTCLVENEAVGVMEPDGRFVLISISDGKTLAEVKLESGPGLRDISLIKSDDRYFVLTNHQFKNGKSIPINALPNQRQGSNRRLYQGRLYAFDSEGKLLWPEPVKVENQMLLSDQFDELPILIFACQHYERKPNGRGQWKPRVLCVDKRTGRKVYEEVFDGHIRNFDVSCNVAKKTISLTMQKATVTLTFTDKPIPPPKAANKEHAEGTPGGNIAHALWDSIRKTFVPNVKPSD